MTLRAEIQRQAARNELATAKLFGIAQGAPGVIQGGLHRTGQVFTLGQAAGQCAGQGAAGAW